MRKWPNSRGNKSAKFCRCAAGPSSSCTRFFVCRQYCVVHDPVDEHLEPRFGAREVRNGECSFFLHPGESIPEGIEDVVVLAAEVC